MLLFLRFPDYLLFLIISEIIFLRIFNYSWEIDSKYKYSSLLEMFIYIWREKEQFCWVGKKGELVILNLKNKGRVSCGSLPWHDNCSRNATKPEVASRINEEKRFHLWFWNREYYLVFYSSTILFNPCKQFSKTEFKYYKLRNR